MDRVQWGADPRQHILIEHAEGSGRSQGGEWVVVIHGGAWRAPVVTAATAEHLLANIKRAHPRKYAGYASLDYRLSPEHKHPVHIDDVVAGVKALVDRVHPSSIVLAGHSCGVFLGAQLHDARVVDISRFVALEGIYNLTELVAEYPDYRGFVSDAFGSDEAKWPEAEPDWASIDNLVVVHSKGDELLSLRQPQWVQRQTSAEYVEIPSGKHDEIFEEADLSGLF